MDLELQSSFFLWTPLQISRVRKSPINIKVCQTWLVGQMQSATEKKIAIGIAVHPFVYVPSIAAFVLSIAELSSGNKKAFGLQRLNIY